MSDVVWIRAHVEQMNETTDYIAFPRAEWEAMSEKQQEEAILDFGTETMNNAGGYGATVVDESEVPAEVKEDFS